ncbi:MAG: hypothetical protein GC165_12525 [Armatimonadetes bacterium]|nr:hypothetical protein [Armatimonadota bacterium]
MVSRFAILVGALIITAGCGGGGGSLASNATGNYSGTVAQSSTNSTIVDFQIAADGTVTGHCAMVSTTSAAIIARATVTGKLNVGAGTFTISGYYTVFVPPPPGTSIGGLVTIFGGIPDKSSDTPIDLTNDGTTYHGVVASVD